MWVMDSRSTDEDGEFWRGSDLPRSARPLSGREARAASSSSLGSCLVGLLAFLCLAASLAALEPLASLASISPCTEATGKKW